MVCLKTIALIFILLIIAFTLLKKKEGFQKSCSSAADCPVCLYDDKYNQRPSTRCLQGKCKCILFD